MFGAWVFGADAAFYLAYLTIVLDNILLTIVVPLVPSWSGALETEARDDVISLHMTSLLNATATKLADTTDSWSSLAAGGILSSRAIAQLLSADAAGAAAVNNKLQVLRAGSLRLAVAAVVFAVCTVMPQGGCACVTAIVGRAVQGCGSARVSVAGLTITARATRAGDRRVAKLLGAVALGVVLGYPLGGLSAALRVSGTTLLLLAGILTIDIVLQHVYLDQEDDNNDNHECGQLSPASPPAGCSLWSMSRAAASVRPCGAAALAVLTTTSAVAALEPCLPPWLHHTFHPQVWVYGVVFVADSLGYLAGTALTARWTTGSRLTDDPHDDDADADGGNTLQLQHPRYDEELQEKPFNGDTIDSKQKKNKLKNERDHLTVQQDIVVSKNDNTQSVKINAAKGTEVSKLREKEKHCTRSSTRSPDGPTPTTVLGRHESKGWKALENIRSMFIRWDLRSVEQTAVCAQIALGVAAVVLPHAPSVLWLAIPQLIIGAGVGALDAALVPALLARAGRVIGGRETARESLVPHTAALLNASSAAAYIIGPVVGSVIASSFGFVAAMTLLGVINLAHAVCLRAELRAHPLTQYADDSPSSDGALRPGEYLQLP